jgi:hypothetical protein
MVQIGLICFLISVGLGLITFFCIIVFPRAFISASITVGFLIMVGSTAGLSFLFTAWLVLMGLAMLVVLLFFWCGICGRFQFSADVLKSAALILRRYPSLFLFNFVMFMLQCALNFLFTSGSILVYAGSISYGVYVYVVISYFWIQSTLAFITYHACA